MTNLKSIQILLGALLFGACDSYTQDEFVPEYIVESYLIAGEPLPALKLSETAPTGAFYRFENYGVDGADVRVFLLDESGSVEKEFRYFGRSNGIYEPSVGDEFVLGKRRYAVEIEVPGGPSTIEASTLVPGEFFIQEFDTDTLTYQEEETLKLDVSRSEYPGRQSIYINKLHAIDTTFALTPFYQGLWEEDEISKEDLIDNSSGIINEANFEPLAGDLLRIELPWVAVAYFGPNDIVVDAIDDNLFDFMRTRDNNGVGPFGEFDNPVDHIEGARGIFGSLARARIRIYVEGSRSLP